MTPAATNSSQPPPPATVVEAVGLTKIFRDFWGRPRAKAVNGIDLHVRQGQVFGLLGPNGAGKSTTVKMLLGLLYPSRGSLAIFGQAATSVEVKRRIGYLPEESYFYKYLTAWETLDFFGALFEIPPAERRRRCDQLLDMVGLTAARNRPVGEFSKGMARRIGLAQALINDPDLVILDEPTSGLDPIGCREVKDLIRLLAARGKTVILCSHLLADVEDLCDEVVVLYGGRIQARGPLKELLTIGDRTRIQLPRLAAPVLDRVLTLLDEAVGAPGQVTVDQPTMDLESFFLDVVRQAQAASLETAGAAAGGHVADYLRGGAAAAAGEALLRRLAGAEEAPPAQPVAAAAPAVPAVDVVRLAALADKGEAEAAPPAAPAESAPGAPSAEELQKANEKLQRLLGG
ncbi:MAG: ABC transporter ATP-binding protein [Lentisphaeria bacterium]|jgi:ABC-2 type transport system ATP-binding protein